MELAGLVGELRLRAEAALYRRLDAGRAAAQIYLRDPAARLRLAGARTPDEDKRVAQVMAAIEAVRTGAPPARVTTMAARLGLDGTATAIAALAAAYAIDLDTRELCHALAARRGKPALYVETCADVLELDGAAVVGALPALRRAKVVALEGDGLAAAVEATASALAWLLGDDGVPAALAHVAALVDEPRVTLPAETCAAVDAMAARATGDVTIILRGPRGSGRRAAAHRLAKARGKPLFAVATPALVALEVRAKAPLLGQALAAARLRDSLVYLADADALFDEHGELAAEHAAALAAMPGAIVAGTAGRAHLDLGRPALAVELRRAELAERERAWTAALEPHGLGATAPELAARYVIGPGAIADVTAEAVRHAAAAAATVDIAALEAAVGRRLALRVGTFGTVVHRKARFADLVLPDDVVETIRDLVAMVRERAQILERWGYQRHLGISRGVSALFSGEPGTGKTMAASVAASELGLELVRIDLSAVVSKYVGETEKNLARIFDEAQDAHAMLLFDEADSLFGKRTELRSAQDRFANLEVNYILQRMESFDGVSVLTTNAESAIDQALQRRLNFRIRFPEPEPDERARLWRQLLPPATGLHDRVDFAALAERFDMTGGYIKNAVVRAAAIAARAGRGMVAEDLWLGAHNEYVEMGKVMPQPRGTL